MATENGAADTAPAPGSIISGALALLAFGSERAVKEFVEEYGLELRAEPRVFRQSVHEPAVAGTVEVVISNVGACALLVPLGISLASQTGIDPRAAAIVVGIGVSNSFILPTHQVNALYMGPGEYRTVDYVKVGGILSAIYIGVLVSVTYLLCL